MTKHILFALIVGLGLSGAGCIFTKSKPATSSSSAPIASEPKNHGQERSEEVHERNEERKEAKDEAKADKKADK
jgi:hypothetical protein